MLELELLFACCYFSILDLQRLSAWYCNIGEPMHMGCKIIFNFYLRDTKSYNMFQYYFTNRRDTSHGSGKHILFCIFFSKIIPCSIHFTQKSRIVFFSKYNHCIVSKNDQPKLSMFHTPYLGARPFSHHFKGKMHSYHTTTKTRCLFFV